MTLRPRIVERLYHVYIGAAYQGPQRATSPVRACLLYAEKHKVRPIILRAETDEYAKALKAAKKTASQPMKG